MRDKESDGINREEERSPQQKDFAEFSGSWGESVRGIWQGLPPEMRGRLSAVLDHMPSSLKGWRSLIDEAVQHARVLTGRRRSVVIAGPANVGKSTLYNQMVRVKTDRAKVSALPGTTRVTQLGDAGLFTAVDTPGADAVGPIGEQEKERALDAVRGADVLVLLFDATHGIRKGEKDLYGEMMTLRRPTVVGLNKVDLVWKERAGVVQKAADNLGLSVEQVIPVSAKTGYGVERLLLAIAKSEPEIVAALGQALPAYRWNLAQLVTLRAASTAAAIAITPLPFLDFFPLLAVQTAMVLGIARIYDYRITLARAKELLATFGLGFLGRTLFHELSKLGGPPGWVLGAAIAAGTTFGMGYASAAWFGRGEKVSRETLKRLSSEASKALVGRLRLLQRRPDKAGLRKRVQQVLGEIPELHALGPGDEAEEPGGEEEGAR
jgi:small GTP-binding protein